MVRLTCREVSAVYEHNVQKVRLDLEEAGDEEVG
jgi:hypothetical protein